MTISAGTHLGPFEVVDLLGAGGMGAVYRAYDPRLRREVAIKVLPPAFSRDPDRLHRFEQEALAVARLAHPNIVAVHDTGRHEDSPFHRHGTARRGNAAPENQRPPVASSPMSRVCRSDCARLGGCARARHRPPRHQAGEPVRHAGWPGQDPRFRPREALLQRCGDRRVSGDVDCRRWVATRNGRIHVA